ncbi:MAG TPA: argininosuccinate lyase [Rhodospirillaceae bacterium]|nr:argininosuccinate lyase [Rhodospirillaceae bacterium]
MWGGRFAQGVAEGMAAINASISVDHRLWRQDIAGSRAHAAMLGAQGIISAQDAAAIDAGLEQIAGEIERGEMAFREDLEDIHMNIEARLAEVIGRDAAGRLHTARSRNDQVATDLRLWVRGAIDTLLGKISTLRAVLEGLEASHEDAVMPGLTHLQPAQPVTLATHLGAYRSMLARDAGRLRDCRARLNESPLGAAALAGTPFPIDRAMTAKALGFSRPMANTMDAVAARDFGCEFLFCCAQCAGHLSRLAEEIILWATPAFGFMRLPDAWSTGSSIMPQKKNPDAAELVRAKAGVLLGNLTALMAVMKGLPLAYNKDMQEDKRPVFDSYDALALSLDAMAGMLTGARFDEGAMRAAARVGFTNATRLADWLVMHLNISFRRAHHITGALVAEAERRGCALEDLPLAAMQAVEGGITEAVYDTLRAV